MLRFSSIDLFDQSLRAFAPGKQKTARCAQILRRPSNGRIGWVNAFLAGGGLSRPSARVQPDRLRRDFLRDALFSKSPSSFKPE
jgi:hypothetical protein